MDHANWTAADWSKVIFSDESRFCFVPDGVQYVRRQPGEEYHPSCVRRTAKHGGGIMVWGCFCAHGVGRLHRVKGNINGAHYEKILKYCMIPSGRHLFGEEEHFFQQDNAPVHLAACARRFLNESGVSTISWPGQSPDLNPIENLWGFMKKELKDFTCRNADELFAKLESVWRDIPSKYLQGLCESMPRRIAKVIWLRGNKAPY